jgi:hypothetical protein
MSFQSMAEAGTGFFHPWSQDTYLQTQGMDDSSGICFAVAAMWIEQRYLAAISGTSARDAFKALFASTSGKSIAMRLQDRHSEAIQSHLGAEPKFLVAAKMSPAFEYLSGSGLGQKGATVTDDLRVLTDFVEAMPGFYFIGAHGSGGGHAFAVHHRSMPARAITLFDPNYGEVTWNSELYYKKEFCAFFSMVRNLVYKGSLSGLMVVFRVGS